MTTQRPPTHPGTLLRDELSAMDMTVKDAAARLGVSRQLLHNIISARAPISPEMALRLGRLIGNGPGLWLRMQQSYDLWHAEREIADDLDRIRGFEVA